MVAQPALYSGWSGSNPDVGSSSLSEQQIRAHAPEAYVALSTEAEAKRSAPNISSVEEIQHAIRIRGFESLRPRQGSTWGRRLAA